MTVVSLRWVVPMLAGILIALAGVFIAAPAVLAPISSVLRETLEVVLGNSALLLVALGLGAGLIGAIIANGSDSVESFQPDLDAILGGVKSIATGETFDARLAEFSDIGDMEARTELESELREELRETALRLLTRSSQFSTAEAEAELADGRWTNDPQAAAFFSRLGPPLRVRLREWLRPRSAVEQRMDRVLAELEERFGLQAAEADAPLDTGSRSDGRRASQLEGAVTHRVDEATGAEIDDRSVETARYPSDQDGAVGGSGRLVATRRFGLTLGLLAAAIGLITNVTAPFLLGFLAVGYSMTKYVTGIPVAQVEVMRVLASDSPIPGDLVEVELSVKNTGERPLTDLRVIDGVPAALRIVEGSPAMATSLQPDSTASMRYAVRAKRGTYRFDETTLITRDLSGVRERVADLQIPTRLTGSTRLEELALEEQASQRIGTVKTDHSGSGVEFFSTRKYRTGDPLSRVNWNQFAKTGDLSTIEFREQRAPTVAIVLDQREAARVAPTEAALDGVDLCVYAAEQAFLTLLDTGTEVGLITYGERLTDIEPANDASHRAMVQSRLRAATDRYAAALGEDSIETAGAVYQRRSPEPQALEHHVPRNAQVLALSPATDEFAVDATERLAALGHQVTLLTPAVTGLGSPGGRRSRLDRACRLEAIRDQGTRVIDWQPDEPLQIAVGRAIEVSSS